MRKKIIIASNVLWSITQFRLGLIKYLVNKDIDITCIADTDDFSELSENKVKEANAKFIRTPLSRKGLNPFSDLIYFIRLLKIYKSQKPDIVINYSIKPIIYGSFAAFLSRIPSFAVITGLGFVFIKNNFLAKIVRLFYKFSLWFPKKVLFLNNDDYELFLKFKIISSKKCIILPGEGIDTRYYFPLPKPHGESFKFLLIARLLWDKGIGEYIEAIKILQSRAEIKNVEFLLLGYIDEANPSGISKELIENWHNNKIINYLGKVEDTRSIIQMVDCVVLPSYREGVPRTLLEAASMEKTIIASNTVGCKDVVEDNFNGFLCKLKDSVDLADKMQKMLLLSKAELDLLGKNGRIKMLRDFDENIIFKIYFNELQKLGFL